VDFAGWYADSYILTNRRVIEQRGVVLVQRREATLRSVQETNYSIAGAEARLFNYGDLKIQSSGRGGGMVFRQVPQPRRIQTLLAAQARAAREEYQRSQPASNAINAALGRIFSGATSIHDAPTQALPPITSAALRAQRRLNLLPDEAVVYTTRRHPITLARALLLPALLLAGGILALIFFAAALPAPVIAGWLVLVACWTLWGILDWRDDLYVLTTDRIIELRRTPLLFELRNVVQLRAVHDVLLRISSVSGRLFNLGTLTIETGSDPLTLLAVPHPDKLQRLIFEGLDAAQQHDKLRDQERLAGTLTEWFEEYHKMQSGP
jgi:uncharacterized membrane protein YdbT with pleckstrin-like domain